MDMDSTRIGGAAWELAGARCFDALVVFRASAFRLAPCPAMPSPGSTPPPAAEDAEKEKRSRGDGAGSGRRGRPSTPPRRLARGSISSMPLLDGAASSSSG